MLKTVPSRGEGRGRGVVWQTNPPIPFKKMPEGSVNSSLFNVVNESPFGQEWQFHIATDI